MEAYPALVRRRIIELYQENNTTQQIAQLFGICRSGTRRIKQRLRERGTLEPSSGKRGRKPKLTPELGQQLRQHIADHPDATRQEVKEVLQLEVSVQTVGEWLTKLGLVLKKSRCMPVSRTVRM